MVRCEECERNMIETRGKVYRCPKCKMIVCEVCYKKLGGNCQFCAPPFEELKNDKKPKSVHRKANQAA